MKAGVLTYEPNPPHTSLAWSAQKPEIGTPVMMIGYPGISHLDDSVQHQYSSAGKYITVVRVMTVTDHIGVFMISKATDQFTAIGDSGGVLVTKDPSDPDNPIAIGTHRRSEYITNESGQIKSIVEYSAPLVHLQQLIDKLGN